MITQTRPPRYLLDQCGFLPTKSGQKELVHALKSLLQFVAGWAEGVDTLRHLPPLEKPDPSQDASVSRLARAWEVHHGKEVHFQTFALFRMDGG